MTSFVVVETQDLAALARALAHGVGDPVADAAFALTDALAVGVAMAGDDPGGTAWARAYDDAALPAARAVVDVANGCYRLAALAGQTARNYDLADAASSARSHTVRDAAVAGLPGVQQIDVSAGPPSAAGGSGGAPVGWSLIESRVGYVWPNGHQDRLRHVGRAWHRAGATLRTHSFDVLLACIELARDGLPEYDDVHAACAALQARMQRLAAVCDSLGEACLNLATHIDAVHTEVRSTLVDLGVESIGIQVLGAAVSAVTFGGAEVPTQGVQVAKIVEVASVVAASIARFVVAARAVAAAVAVHIAEAARLARELAAVRDLRIVSVAVHGVGRLPAVVRVPEGAAIMRMERAAASAPQELLTRSRGEAFVLRYASDDGPLAKIPLEKRWSVPGTLGTHLTKHGAELSVTSREEYVRNASAFLQNALDKHLPMKLDEEGILRVWDPETKIFASYDRNGLCRTIFYEPRTGYLDRQRGVRLW